MDLMNTHMSVVSEKGEQHLRVRRAMLQFAVSLEETYEQLTVSTYSYRDEPDEFEPIQPDEYHSANTMQKVYNTLRGVTIIDAREFNLRDDDIVNIVTALQNAGILFRERAPE
jgi:hypothetical protein